MCLKDQCWPMSYKYIYITLWPCLLCTKRKEVGTKWPTLFSVTSSDRFLSTKIRILIFIFKFLWILFQGIQLTKRQYWLSYDFAGKRRKQLPESMLVTIRQQCGAWLSLLTNSVSSRSFSSRSFSPPPRINDPDIHHGTCVTHVPWCRPDY